MTMLEAAVMKVKNQQQPYLLDMRLFMAARYPNTLAALKEIELERTKPKRRKGFSLIKRESKKHGVRYYVRYSHNGKMLPTKWNTHTDNEAVAEQYAVENKIRLVERYLGRKDGKMYSLLEGFYTSNPETLAYTRNVSEKRRRYNHSVIRDHFLPFLKNAKITNFEQITKMKICDFQDYLLSTGLKPQTINNKLMAIKNIFAYAARKGMIDNDLGEQIKGVPVHNGDRSIRGCYELEKLKDVFYKNWKEELYYLLNLLIYTTGMRNSEILRIKPEDFILINGCRFIQVNSSKTQSGIRTVPLHDFVYEKLMNYYMKNKKGQDNTLFGIRSQEPFKHANACLGGYLGFTEDQLKAENITFYSGRHFFKTMMSSEGLGEEIEEIFMGHKVSANVAKLYNHRDKIGKERLAKKAKQVFSILDRCLFVKKR